MKDILKEVLNEVHTRALRTVPLTYKVWKNSPSILDVLPKDLPSFIEKHGIPENAGFDVDDDNNPVLSYKTEIPTTARDKVNHIKKTMNNCGPTIFKALTEAGYRRVGFDSGKLREFADTSVYDMWFNDEWERLTKYYSLYFEDTKEAPTQNP